MGQEPGSRTRACPSIAYDFRDRLTSAVETNAQETVLEQESFTYDALDNRIETTTNGVSTWTLYSGSSPIMDFTGAGALAVRYLQGPMGVLSRQTSTGAVAWYLADQLGTVRDLIDNSGNVIDHVDFSAFGMVLGETAPTVGDRMMGFAGLERDSLTGLNLAVMRAQNPGTGRWTTQDPLSFAAGDANLYRYVGNGPNSHLDPIGEDIFLDPSKHTGGRNNHYGIIVWDPKTGNGIRLEGGEKQGGTGTEVLTPRLDLGSLRGLLEETLL